MVAAGALSGWASVVLMLSLFAAICYAGLAIGAAIDSSKPDATAEWWDEPL